MPDSVHSTSAVPSEDLPELPPRVGQARQCHGFDVHWMREWIDAFMSNDIDSTDLFTAAQMKAYATAAVMAEREACALVCEHQNQFEQGDWQKGYELATSDCAAAIRSRCAK